MILAENDKELRLKAKLDGILNDHLLNLNWSAQKDEIKVKIKCNQKDIKLIRKKEIAKINDVVILQISLIGREKEKYFFPLDEEKFRTFSIVEESIRNDKVKIVFKK